MKLQKYNLPILIDNARADEASAILEIMKHWNMHHVPSPEMKELDMDRFYTARIDEKIVGAAGYEILSQDIGKTTLLSVLPEYNGRGIGSLLQHARCVAMYELGIKRVITNADLPKTIAWYQKRYGYRIVGKLKKLVPFGSPDIDSWTTLELDLVAYILEYSQKN